MKIKQELFDAFIKQSKYKAYKKMCKSMLLGDKAYSLKMQGGYDESEYLPENIQSCVKGYTNDKDMAIAMFRDFVEFLRKEEYQISIEFPPIPVNSSFERQMFIAKYLQEENHSLKDLSDILWVGDKTLREDLKRLGGEDPIQVCGKKFYIPDLENEKGKVKFASTMHPVFLAENLTQIIVMLKGLKTMSSDPLYENYAKESAGEIWNQLSSYAKRRIKYVLKDLLPEDLEWYESLQSEREESFYTEKMCSQVHSRGSSVILNCIKNGKTFVVEYKEGDNVAFYKNCRMIEGSYRVDSIEIECDKGRKTLMFNNVLRSSYLAEELLAD